MLPIAILPVAGLLLGIGSSFTNETTIATYGLQKILGDETVLHALLTIMNKVGSAVFDNLPLIFAVGVAIGMAKKEKEVAALSALIAYFVMNVAINGMLVVTGEITADGQIAKDVLEGTIASVCGIQSLQMGVFGGIIVGLGVAALHNRFHKIALPNALSFLEVLDLFRLSLQLYICLLELVCILCGRRFRMASMRLEGWLQEADMREL